MNYPTFTSESVCAGHPDKIADQISDAILDEALRIDPMSRVAIETLVTKNHVTLAGEITCGGKIAFKTIVKKVIKDLGFNNPKFNFDKNAIIDVHVHQQSCDIAMGVDCDGAGDQGMMFGYATDETANFMPLPIDMAHTLAQKLDELRKTKLKYLRPDGKTQVTISYKNNKPEKLVDVVVAVPHDPKIELEELRNDLWKYLVLPTIEKYKLNVIDQKDFIVNGTGKWEIGGPATDTGVTGRKIVVDTYGGMGRLGGGCFSGKDPSKVDRSAAYAARFIAKNIVAAGLASRVEVQLAYFIGSKLPVNKSIETFGTSKKSQKEIEDFAWNLIDLSPKGIIKALKLRRPIYQKTAAYGHFGNSKYPWEKIVNTK